MRFPAGVITASDVTSNSFLQRASLPTLIEPTMMTNVESPSLAENLLRFSTSEAAYQLISHKRRRSYPRIMEKHCRELSATESSIAAKSGITFRDNLSQRPGSGDSSSNAAPASSPSSSSFRIRIRDLTAKACGFDFDCAGVDLTFGSDGRESHFTWW